MEHLDEMLERYAKLVVKQGIHIQPGQSLVVRTGLEAAPFVRKVVEHAYDLGAKQVHVEWADEEVQHTRLMKAPEESLKQVPEWRVKGLEQLAAEGAGFLSIYSPNPDLFSDVNPERFAIASRAGQTASRGLNKYIQTDKVSWCVVSVATEPWAKSLFPELSAEQALDKLWSLIFMATRVSQDDPEEAWKQHVQNLQERLAYLNARKFRELHYTAPGTDLKVELPEGHIWVGAGAKTPEGTFFLPNIPTEEVFTLPLKTGVNGVVSSTKPLNYGGKLLENFELTFENGRIVHVEAESGLEVLKNLVDTDEGSHFLGEIALVPDNSPISQSNVVFKNTLFDENASNHLAIGSAYPTCLTGGEKMNETELAEHGVNTSVVHVDFMIGSAQMNIDAKTADGESIPLFRNGNWV